MTIKYAHWATHAPLIKKSIITRFKFDEDLGSNEDYDFYLRVSEKFNFDYIDEVLCTVDETRKGISQNPKTRLNSTIRLINKHKRSFFFTRLDTTFKNLWRFSLLFLILLLGKHLDSRSMRLLDTIAKYR